MNRRATIRSPSRDFFAENRLSQGALTGTVARASGGYHGGGYRGASQRFSIIPCKFSCVRSTLRVKAIHATICSPVCRPRQPGDGDHSFSDRLWLDSHGTFAEFDGEADAESPPYLHRAFRYHDGQVAGGSRRDGTGQFQGGFPEEFCASARDAADE